MEIGTIIEIAKTDNGDIECRVDFGSGDECTATFGQKSSAIEYPMIDDEVAVSRDGAENIIVASFPSADGISTGESIQYSRDASGLVSASVKCTSDGDVIHNGGSESAVSFSALKTGFDQLKSDFNNFMTVYNAAQWPVNVTTLLAGPPSVPGVPSSATIDPSESETVKIP